MAVTSSIPVRSPWMAEPVVAGLVRTADGLMLLGTSIIVHPALWAAETPFWPAFYWPELFLALLGILLMLHVFALFGLYAPHRLTALSARSVVWAHVTVSAGIALIFLLLTAEYPMPWIWLPAWLGLSLAGFLGLRLGLRMALRRWSAEGRLARNIIIVGDPELTVSLADQLAAAKDPTARLVGLFHDPDAAPDLHCPYPVLGTGAGLVEFARSTPVDEVIVALPWHAEERLMTWMSWLRNIPSDVLLCPPVASRATPTCAVEVLGGMPLLKVAERPLSGWGYVIKVIEDRTLAGLIFLAVAPLLLLIAVLIRLDSPGPVLFRQKRHGFNNNVFDVLKFRTMSAAASQGGMGTVTQATRDDPRVTRIGRWLRKSSLDELPQLLNVLKGDMSLVGPRPHAVAHNEQYAQVINTYLARHRVKPGITGWAQVNGYRGETDTLDKMEKRVQHDLYYIEHWSLLLDLEILARTIGVVFFSRNAY